MTTMLVSLGQNTVRIAVMFFLMLYLLFFVLRDGQRMLECAAGLLGLLVAQVRPAQGLVGEGQIEGRAHLFRVLDRLAGVGHSARRGAPPAFQVCEEDADDAGVPLWGDAGELSELAFSVAL